MLLIGIAVGHIEAVSDRHVIQFKEAGTFNMVAVDHCFLHRRIVILGVYYVIVCYGGGFSIFIESPITIQNSCPKEPRKNILASQPFPKVKELFQPRVKSGNPFPVTCRSSSQSQTVPSPFRSSKTGTPFASTVEPSHTGPQKSPRGSPSLTLTSLVSFCPGRSHISSEKLSAFSE